MRYLLFVIALLVTVMGNQAIMAEDTPDIVELVTNLGTITIRLDYQNAPITAHNFITYVNNKFYQNTLFHRVIKGFVIQGGGYNKLDGKLKTTLPPIANEASNGLKNLTGTIAMARTSDPNSATSQFFINLNDNAQLNASTSNAGYTVFGTVIAGMTVVKQIGDLATYSELPYTNTSALIVVDNVYSYSGFTTTIAKTRISINGVGKVVSDPVGINCGTSCVLSQLTSAGTLKLKATPMAGNLFSGWRGDCYGFNATITLDPRNGNHNCTAMFTKTLSTPQ